MSEGFFFAGVERRVEPGEELETSLRDVAEDLAAIGEAAFTRDELFFLETIDEPRDAGSLLDEALDDVQSGQPRLARAAEDAQDVVLLRRDAVRVEDGGDIAADQVRGPQQRHRRLLRLGGERLDRKSTRLKSSHIPLF